MPDNDTVIATIRDPQGRTVQLTQAAWEHIQEGHPDMANFLEDIKKIVQTAEIRTAGRFPDTEKLWAQNRCRCRWAMVVVRYEGRIGSIRTAHRFKRGPGNEARL